MAPESAAPEQLPRHVAIIMDGNGRWAQQRHLPRLEGHRRGEKTVREIIEVCGELGIGDLTLYTFSLENWRRSQREIGHLMGLIEAVARKNIRELCDKNVRLRVLGSMEELPASLRRELERDIELTRHNTGLNVNLALNYGGRREIVQAAQNLARQVAAGTLQSEDIDEDRFAQELYCPDMPDPDLLIRTGGEMRLSNFLLWEIAYSEIWVTDVLWPDFNRQHLLRAFEDYGSRQRRFGGVPEETPVPAEAADPETIVPTAGAA